MKRLVSKGGSIATAGQPIVSPRQVANAEIKLRPKLKRKIKGLPLSISDALFGNEYALLQFVFTMIEYQPALMKYFILLNKEYSQLLQYELKARTLRVCKEIQLTYQDYLLVKKSWIYQSAHGELVKVIKCKLLNNWQTYMNCGKCFTIQGKVGHRLADGAQYSVYDQGVTYSMDLIPAKQARTLWLHKNESASHGMAESDELPYLQPIGAIALDDCFTIALPLFSISGHFLDYKANSIVQFEPPIISELPPSFKPKEQQKYYKPNLQDLMYKTKQLHFWKEDYYQADLNRVCEMEELVNEWYDLDLQS